MIARKAHLQDAASCLRRAKKESKVIFPAAHVLLGDELLLTASTSS